MKIKKYIKLFFENYWDFLFSIFLSLLIFPGFYRFYLTFGENIVRFYWEVIIFSFIAGALALTIKLEEKNTKSLIQKIGFGMILAGIIILLGVGFFGLNFFNGSKEYGIAKIGVYVCLSGVYVFSFCISYLFVAMGKYIFLQKK